MKKKDKTRVREWALSQAEPFDVLRLKMFNTDLLSIEAKEFHALFDEMIAEGVLALHSQGASIPKNGNEGDGKGRKYEPTSLVKMNAYLNSVTPRHKVDDPQLVERLKTSFLKNGWQGRPVLVLKMSINEESYETITGVHRTDAAMKAGIQIPALVLYPEDLAAERIGEYLAEAIDDAISRNLDALPDLLEQAGLPEAAQLMRLEKEFGGTAKKVTIPKRKGANGRLRIKRLGAEGEQGEEKK